jgi:hypothetical protein
MLEIRYVLQIEDFMEAISAAYASDKRAKRIRVAQIAIGTLIIPLVFYNEVVWPRPWIVLLGDPARVDPGLVRSSDSGSAAKDCL